MAQFTHRQPNIEKKFPEPSISEFDTLNLHIIDWGNRTPIERAICLAILRGYHYPSRIAAYLGLDESEIDLALPILLKNGLLRDRYKLLLH